MLCERLFDPTLILKHLLQIEVEALIFLFEHQGFFERISVNFKVSQAEIMPFPFRHPIHSGIDFLQYDIRRAEGLVRLAPQLLTAQRTKPARIINEHVAKSEGQTSELQSQMRIP